MVQQLDLFSFISDIADNIAIDKSEGGLSFRREIVIDATVDSEKILSVKRDVKTIYKEKLEKSGLSNFLEMKFSFNVNHSSSHALGLAVNKIANKILIPRLLDITDVAGFEKLVSELNIDKYCSINVMPADSDEADMICACMQEKNIKQSEIEAYLPAKISISDSSGCMSYITTLNRSIKTCYHDTVRYFRRANPKRLYVLCDIAKTLAYIMLLNSIRGYALSNSSEIAYAFFSDLQKNGIFELPNELNTPYLNTTISNLGFSFEFRGYAQLKVRSNMPEYFLFYIEYFKNPNRWLELSSLIAQSTDLKLLIEAGGLSGINNKLTPRFSQIREGKSKVLLDCFKKMVLTCEVIKTESEMEYSNSSDYAASYETKKNIPEKIINAMKKSLFNEYFGYVEFDCLTDLKAMEQIQQEFLKLAKQLNLSKQDDHSIRFRRLGKHRAGGLYYPCVKALCVDLDAPSSLVHEYFHLIDYTNDKLSDKSSFIALKERYKDVMNERVANLSNNNPLKEVWYGTTKYNKSYYFQSTEIFARLGEIYVQHILKINNSLVDTSKSEVYPYEDEVLFGMIKSYFSNIL